MANWYAGAVIFRLNGGSIEFLVIDTKSLHKGYEKSARQTKFVGGTEDGHLSEDKNILGTLRRELTEETDMSIPDGWNPQVIHSINLTGHFKNFYLIPFEVLRGQLRTVEKTIDFDWMSVPYWVDFDRACRIVFRSHQDALMKAHSRLMRAA